MADDLKAGDVVKLKSGGPEMTIENLGTYSEVLKADCTWFATMERRSDLFAVVALKRVAR